MQPRELRVIRLTFEASDLFVYHWVTHGLVAEERMRVQGVLLVTVSARRRMARYSGRAVVFRSDVVARRAVTLRDAVVA